MRHPYRQRRPAPYRYPMRRRNRWLNRVATLTVLLASAALVATIATWLLPQPDPVSTASGGAAPDPSKRSSPKLPSLSEEDGGRSTSSGSGSTAQTVVDATVCVKGVLPDGTEVCASGVSIDPELVGIDPKRGSVVVTNYHVVVQAGENPPILLGGRGDEFDSELIDQAPGMDLALLLVPDVKLPIATLAETSPAEGTPVQAIGFPNNQPLTIRDSILLGRTYTCLALPPCLAIQQGTITHGNSGGPLEANGEIVGITQGETTEEIAIPIEQVHQFLAGDIPASARQPQVNPGYPAYPGQPPAPAPWGRQPARRGWGYPPTRW